jgi:hypothetical protein
VAASFELGMTTSMPLEPDLAPCGWLCPHWHLTLMRPCGVSNGRYLVMARYGSSNDVGNAQLGSDGGGQHLSCLLLSVATFCCCMILESCVQLSANHQQ